MSEIDKPKTKPFTKPEQEYLLCLNNEVLALLQQLRTAQGRLSACVTFLREQHNAPEDWWELLSIGFVEKPTA